MRWRKALRSHSESQGHHQRVCFLKLRAQEGQEYEGKAEAGQRPPESIQGSCLQAHDYGLREAAGERPAGCFSQQWSLYQIGAPGTRLSMVLNHTSQELRHGLRAQPALKSALLCFTFWTRLKPGLLTQGIGAGACVCTHIHRPT